MITRDRLKQQGAELVVVTIDVVTIEERSRIAAILLQYTTVLVHFVKALLGEAGSLSSDDGKGSAEDYALRL